MVLGVVPGIVATGTILRYPGQQSWMNIPPLTILHDNADALLVIAGQCARDLGMAGWMEPYFLPNPEVHHGGMRPQVTEKAQAGDDLVI